MKEWTSKTGGCITFRERTNERNYLEFFVGNGCWGHLGKPNGKSQISVGRGCEGQNVMAHEIGHALGFWYVRVRLFGLLCLIPFPYSFLILQGFFLPVHFHTCPESVELK